GLEPAVVAGALDASRALLLPSASEGLPRVAIESFVRGRAVVGARAGGIPDIVEHEHNGLLVPPGDPYALAAAIERVLFEPGLAERLGGAAHESAGRWRRIAREPRPVAIVTQSPYEAAFVWLARTGARIVVELHGDWRTATRLYGSPLRRALSPLADAVGTFGLRRAAAVRTISSYTTGLVREVGVEPAAEFPAFMDLEVFSEREPVPLPPTPAALFVGVLELYNNVDGLARIWRLVVHR